VYCHAPIQARKAYAMCRARAELVTLVHGVSSLERPTARLGPYPIFLTPPSSHERSYTERPFFYHGLLCAYPIPYRQLEEMMGERGVTVDHSTLTRWVIKYVPELEKQFRRRQHPVGRSWR